ncbi:PE-PPE domain-containing protein [Mycolicibacterium komossense]|uniref:PE-PPE domain-containing protein n=1 Tax=Mycolicibacterium komossense TaxID=1779 RepID=A0ABT3CDQ9_9MYCO|nr:PE-PPE domain-containing protein [Mycolicibacterium komossense]MCV7227599.1 PE-PPE domain-containing protein [Mycolicibacterium komossense]
MNAAPIIGRVGGLAIALGVGAAIAGGSGVAWADSSVGTSAGSSASSHAPSASKTAVTRSSGSATARSAGLRPVTAQARTATVARPASAAKVTAAGAGPAAGDNPVSPAEAPVALALAAFTRRESLSSAAAPAAMSQTTAVIMSPSGVPIVSPDYLARVFALYVAPNSPVGTTPEGLDTPEGLYPITGVKSLPLNTSVDQGLQILGTEIQKQLNAGNAVTVFGYSQSAVISSLAMQDLDPSLPLSFILVGNEMNPNGGLLSRFPGMSLPALGIPFYGPTPADAFPTTNYTLEYDGFADFPRYPLNFLADLNAGLGIVFVHTKYADLTPDQVTPVAQGGQAIELPTSSPTQHYYVIPTENLPLLEPLRLVPLIGTPLADLLQPALTVIVNLGYGDPKYGWSTAGYANEVTPFGVLPDVDWGEVAGLLAAGAQQGVTDFLGDLRPGGSIAHELSAISLPTPDQVVADLQALPMTIAYTISNAASAAYAALLPTADIINSLVTVLPAYNLTLFLGGIEQVLAGDIGGGLVNAVGLPLAADVGLITTAGLIELLVLGQAVEGVIQA